MYLMFYWNIAGKGEYVSYWHIYVPYALLEDIAGKGELCLLLVHVHYALLENITGKGELCLSLVHVPYALLENIVGKGENASH